MEVRASSPQEDEFALLSLGARSPYEALIIPTILPEALKLTDPRDLSPADEKHWREVFLSFLAGVSVRGNGRPMILKSPDSRRSRLDAARTASGCAIRVDRARSGDQLRIGGAHVAEDV